MSDLTDVQERVLELLPATRKEIAEELELSRRAVRYHMEEIEEKYLPLERDSNYVWYVEDGGYKSDGEEEISLEEELMVELEDVIVEEEDPAISDLTTREEYILGELETGSTIRELADDLSIRPSVVKQHLTEVKRRGWEIYRDETSGRIAIESDNPIRSSEHKGTRTRKANRWWELKHNELVREFRGLDPVKTEHPTKIGNEDWITHMTDLHAGDYERSDDGSVVYETEMVPDIIDYITDQSLYLADKHNSEYDTAHLLWGGDFVTGEAIYEGQFEDLDAWLDEQHDTLIDPLVRQIKSFSDSEQFESVKVVCIVGNHGKNRASATSRQANADLIVYKTVRNVISKIQEHSDLMQNVTMKIGEAKPYRNFDIRGGRLKGHLRHGQHRKPQAETSARENQWRGTLIDHNFDIAYMGHYHISGRIPWDGPPVIVSPSPKPAGGFVEKLGGRVDTQYQGVATAHGVSDDGITAVFPIDMRKY